jgi:hypothetical protein
MEQGMKPRDKRQLRPAGYDAIMVAIHYVEAKRLGLWVDHMVPLCGAEYSGLHVHYNLELLTQEENQQKGNKVARHIDSSDY